jgi:hypothetical protein
VGQFLHRPWKFLALAPDLWLLVKFRDTGIVDHPLREAGGGPEGKAELKWYQRRHEVVGIGSSPAEAAHGILSGGKGARLRAKQVRSVEDRRLHLVFYSMDNGAPFVPTRNIPTLRQAS